MKKTLIIVFAILSVGAGLFVLYSSYWDKARDLLADFQTKKETKMAWYTFDKYREFAKEHNLEGIRSLSHQISDTCNDVSKEKECFALMDSVVEFTKDFKIEDFKYVQYDKKQLIMNTEGPDVVIIYFTKDSNKVPKVLGMRFCYDEKMENNCVERDPAKRDLDGNGWWDEIESRFR